MKRVLLFSLVFLALVLTVGGASASAADPVTKSQTPALQTPAIQTPAAQPVVSVEAIDQEVALLARSGVVSQAPPCTACIAQAGACSGGAGTVCNKASRCTCQWCGGNLVCRPRSGPIPFPIPDPDIAD